ncbi:MAG TPA: Holliday junction branch migration protein RuvA [Sandaracinaceae bacterium LLY-WYZ-13_1]|nr:Holliday junction branch migration protein RuvA [Sandaracinaceae bacterium LLY-WYZ-13_1]
MIGRLRGVIADRHPDGSCIVDVAGVGYEVFVPLGTLGKLPSPPEAVTLHVHTHVREDQLVLYGFGRAEDRTAFRTLLGISNVGPKLALAILSSMDARQLAAAIASQDKARFKGIPGVGKRTADRLLLELKDKLGFVSLAAAAPAPKARKNGRAPAPAPDGDENVLATVAQLLVNMGFKPAEADQAVAAIAEDAGEDATVEKLMKRALVHLG